MNFGVDTGAAIACIRPDDAVEMLGIPRVTLSTLDQFGEPDLAIGIGGSARYFPLPAELGFPDENGALPLVSQQLQVAELTDSNRFVPSRLGSDILRDVRPELGYSRNPVALHDLPA